MTDGLVAAVGEQDGQLVTVSDTCLTYASPAGEVRATYSYAGSYLREYDLHGDGFTALLLNRYKSGGVGRLVTVDTDGQEIAALDVNEEILSISAAGRYLAVLYMDSVVIYTEELEIYAQPGGHGLRPVGSDAPGWLCPAAGGRERPPVPALSGKH